MVPGTDGLVADAPVKAAARVQRPSRRVMADGASASSSRPAAPWLIPTLIAIGIVLRLVPFFGNRSLWVDEAMLAYNLIHRSWLELFQTLDLNQAAPLGFLLSEKLFITCFGTGELALRLGPLLFGLASLFLFVRVARQSLPPRAVPVALALFAAAPSLIYYSSELKQYSSDVFWALLCYSAPQLSPEQWSKRAALAWGLLGGVAVWFSFPAVFVLAGLGTVWAVERACRKDGASLGKVAIAIALWGASFAAYYFCFLRQVVASDYLIDFWTASFMPFPPTTQGDIGWFIDTFFQVLRSPVGLAFNITSLAGVGALAFLFGCIALWGTERRRLILLLAPVAFTLLVSGLHKYPFAGRLLLFLVPGALLILAAGAEYIRARTAAALPLLGTAVLGLLLFGPVATAAQALVRPQAVEESRPVLKHLKDRWQELDSIYVYNSAWPAFAYYAPRLHVPMTDCFVGKLSRTDWSVYLTELRKLRGRKRVWLLFSHIRDAERRFFLTNLDEMGARRDSCTAAGTGLYLYDLSGAEGTGHE